VIFITHAHYDHFSPDDILKASCHESYFVFPAGMEKDAAQLGFPEKNFIFCKPGQSYTINGILFEALPAYNRLKPFHPKKNGWLGFVVSVGGVRVYVAGDTDALSENEKISCDIALLPIGGKYTMNAREAAALTNAIRPSAVIPTHYGTIVGSPSDFEAFMMLVQSCEVVRKLNF
jgi:L-ascorbate metabolism protein UlaG (beta-lactamase superfamily)